MCRALLSRCDGLGSERTVTNASQTVLGTISYDAFGHAIGITGSSTNPYLFAATWGYRNDGDAGLMHVGARYYDAQVGRFLTRDTVLSEHPYLYCEHEPVNHIDPDGHDLLDIVKGGAKLIGGALATATGIKLYYNWREAQINAETAANMRKMIHEYEKHSRKSPDEIDWGKIWAPYQYHIGKSMPSISDFGGSASKWIYGNRPGKPNVGE
jgi:RHS repeat-associated protein